MPYYQIEIIVIVAVIIYQVTHSVKLYGKIIRFKNIFDNPIQVKNGYIERENLNKPEKNLDDIVFFDEDSNGNDNQTDDKNIVKIAIVETSGMNGEISNIRNAINSYLLNNFGAAVNFSIIKDIIDRDIDVEDDEISQAISTPLYLGLASAMLGIIFGLFSIPELSGTNFLKDIEPFLQGVKTALFASLTGLVCTTVLSSVIYRDAKKKLLKAKNAQISYLQAKLLPELIKAEDTGVSGLKASLDRFAREATKIADNVLVAANQTGENISLQQEVLDRVERINVTKVSKTNLELFDRLETNMDAFNRFSEFISSMMKISENLNEFATRTTSIDKIAGQIDSSLQESARLTRFLATHFEKIEAAGSASLKAVDLSDAHFKEAIDKLKEETDNRIAKLNSQASNHESQLSEIYNSIGKSLENITAEHITQFQESYIKGVPQFNQLDNLALLPGFQDILSTNAEQLQNDLNNNSEKFIESLNKLHSSLASLKDQLSNNAILSKLNSIEQLLSKRKVSYYNPQSGGRDRTQLVEKKSYFRKSIGRLKSTISKFLP